MGKLEIEASALSTALASIAGAIPTKAITPITAFVNMKAKDGICVFTATDHEITAISQCKCGGDISVCADYGKLSKIVQKFPKDMMLTIEAGEEIKITNEDSTKEYVIEMMPSDDFPTIPDINGKECKVTAADFIEAATTCRMFLDEKQDLKPATAALNFFTGDKLTIIGGTGTGTGQVIINGSIEKNFIITPRAIALFNTATKGIMSIYQGERHVKITSGDLTVIVLKVDVKPLLIARELFENAEKEKHFDINIADLRGALSRLSTFRDETGLFFLQMSVKDGKLTIKSEGIARESYGQEILSINQYCDDIDIKTNGQMIVDAISRFKSQSIQFYLEAYNKPIVIRSEESKEREFLIAPITKS